MTRWISIILFFAMTSVAMAIEDTPQNREQQADRYLQAVSMREMMEGMMKPIAANLPQAEAAVFIELMLKNLNYDTLNTATRSALTKTFTADEIAAMADLASSPVGKSAMSKMSTLMAEYMKSDAVRKAMLGKR
jgi:hypothetical protein